MSDPLDTAYAYFQLNPVQNGPPVIYVGTGFLPTSTFVSRDLPVNSIYRDPAGGQSGALLDVQLR